MYFFRPGYRNFIKEIFDHPRITFGFYSSIMLKNIVPVMYELLTDDLMPLLSKFNVFDQSFCPLMKDHPYYTEIKTDTYDRYRDLHEVFKSEICTKKGFSFHNTLLIDSDSDKVQLFLENSIVNEPYKMEDVQFIEHKDGSKRDNKWHEDHMAKLTDFVIAMADEADSVPDWLLTHLNYQPLRLLPDFSVMPVVKTDSSEESKEQDGGEVHDREVLTEIKEQ
jgi:hypothetical protein